MTRQFRIIPTLPEDWALVPSTQEGCLTSCHSNFKGSDTFPQGHTNKCIHKYKQIFWGEDWYTILHLSLWSLQKSIIISRTKVTLFMDTCVLSCKCCGFIMAFSKVALLEANGCFACGKWLIFLCPHLLRIYQSFKILAFFKTLLGDWRESSESKSICYPFRGSKYSQYPQFLSAWNSSSIGYDAPFWTLHVLHLCAYTQLKLN